MYVIILDADLETFGQIERTKIFQEMAVKTLQTVT